MARERPCCVVGVTQVALLGDVFRHVPQVSMLTGASMIRAIPTLAHGVHVLLAFDVDCEEHPVGTVFPRHPSVRPEYKLISCTMASIKEFYYANPDALPDTLAVLRHTLQQYGM